MFLYINLNDFRLSQIAVLAQLNCKRLFTSFPLLQSRSLDFTPNIKELRTIFIPRTQVRENLMQQLNVFSTKSDTEGLMGKLQFGLCSYTLVNVHQIIVTLV